MSSDPSSGLSGLPVIPSIWGLGLLPVSLWFSLSPPGLSSDPQLCNDLELCDEAMALLDEVIMCTFQQSVYYLTKVGLGPPSCLTLHRVALTSLPSWPCKISTSLKSRPIHPSALLF